MPAGAALSDQKVQHAANVGRFPLRRVTSCSSRHGTLHGWLEKPVKGREGDVGKGDTTTRKS